MPEATVDDVHAEIDTVLENADIQDVLDRVERDWKREYDSSDFEDTTHIVDFEATLTALRIAEGLDRRAEQVSAGGVDTRFETSEIENLRARARRADPGQVFGRSQTLTRDTDRYVGSSGD